ncbi:hypothetical protein [Tessaracoccus sp.]
MLEFFRLKNELGKNPDMGVQPLADITTGQTWTIQISTIAEYREKGYVQTGDTAYFVTSVGEIANRDGGNRVAVLEVCTDAHAVDLVDQTTGLSVLSNDRTYFVKWNIEVLHEGYAWKIGDITSDRTEECGS